MGGVTTYRAKRKNTVIGGVDVNGRPHPDLVFDEDGLLDAEDDQTYGQTIRHALSTGLITHARVTDEDED
jgi:hypothetical protein